MLDNGKILLGKANNKSVHLLAELANRHGLIAGATGTGKTVTLKVLAEGFSDLGVPVFLADIKGDVSGLCKKGEASEKVLQRIEQLGLENFQFKGYPVRFFDVFQKAGHPIRCTISEMGPELLSRLMNLTEVQSGVLNIVFRIADDMDLKLIDLKDLRSMLQYVAEHNKDYTAQYGNVSKQSVGAIQRAMLVLEDNGGDLFFGEPELDLNDWMQQAEDGRGYINILHGVELVQTPLLYSTFLLWLLSELFENLPEVGDLDKPKMVFFFDEAHYLFNDAPKVLIQKIEQTVKLIRSKGIGVYFITQNPSDLPDAVLAQLSNRIQHALRAYTPAEMKSIKAAADSFRVNPEFDTKEVLCELQTGEALVSCLDEKGRPSVVERTMICPTQSYMAAIDQSRRKAVITSSDLYGKYEELVDNESAYELLEAMNEEESVEEKTKQATIKTTKKTTKKKSVVERAATNAMSTLTRETTKDLIDTFVFNKDTSRRQSSVQKAANSAIRTLSGELGKSISRGLFGVLKK